MLAGVGQTKNSATWGGAKTNPTPTDNKGGDTTSNRKRSNSKRAMQFLLCFGIVLMFVVNASAKKISKHLSPELYQMVLNNDPNQTVDVIVQYKQKVRRQNLDNAAGRGAKAKRQFNLINGVQMSISLAQVSDLAEDSDVRYVTL
ncbi:MAG TPA: hypothetical protein VFP40_17230, partial [Terriglobales bacterium]|nr:hypothetical protein [Terriglobales bacterium]